MPNSTPASRDAWTATAWSTASAGASCDGELGDAPQRGLLVGERLQLAARLAVGQRGGDELGERLQPLLGCGAGSGASPEVAVSIPHTSPSTEIGAATAAASP